MWKLNLSWKAAGKRCIVSTWFVVIGLFGRNTNARPNCKEHNYFSPEAEWNRAASAYIIFGMHYPHKIQVLF